jgi:hypothetical protein
MHPFGSFASMALIAALALPSNARATARAAVQDAASEPPPAAATAVPARVPLFQVRYVLEPAAPQRREHPPLDFGDGQPAIRDSALLGAPAVLLRGVIETPNVIVCRGWSCEQSSRR